MTVNHRKAVLVCGAASVALMFAGAASAQQRSFNLPSEDADKAIPEFARQAGLQIVAPADELRGVQTPAIRGQQDARAALRSLLAGTGLSIAADDGAVITLRRADSSPPQSPAAGPRDPVAAAASSRPAAIGEVVVTASRVQRSGFTAPTPTVVQSAEQLRQQGLTNVNDLLNENPSVRGSTTAANAGGSAGMYDNPGQNLVNLRNLGSGTLSTPDRTLVLVDGDRVVFNTAGGGVDLNTIPSIMLDRTEVVTGGASAAYGSDAVAGVVNLILKKNIRGFQAEASYGQSTYGDDRNGHLAVMDGMDLLGGHLLAAAQYDYSEGTGNVFTNPRGWLKAQYGVVIGAKNARFYAPDVQLSNTNYGGLITGCQVGTTANANCVLRGTAFAADGSPYAFVYGNQFGNPTTPTSAGASNMAGGGNKFVSTQDSPANIDPNERFNFLGRYDRDLTDHIQATVKVNVELQDSNHLTVEPRDPALVTAAQLAIPTTNPYLPASVKALMISNKITAFNISRAEIDIGAYEVQDTNQVYQAAFDLKGDFGAIGTDWNWDGHMGYGSNLNVTKLLNNRIDAKFLQAFNTDTDPVTNSPECSSATARAAGCLPFNPFGLNRNSQATLKYFQGTSTHYQHTERTDFAANVHGSPFSTWAGKVSVAAGGEYRIDKLTITTDALSASTGWNVNNVQPVSGSVNVGEVYGEAVVPLVSNMLFAQEVDFDGAIRATRYNLSGDTTTWKAGIVWQVNDDIRFRASSSRDIRAPNVSELFQSPSTAPLTVNVILPGSPLPQTVFSTTITQGNLNLKPEVANTLSYGVGFSPSFLPGFRASIDYYDIKINGAISTTAAQTIITNCQNGNLAYCPALVINGSSATVYLQPLNINSLKTSGVDIDVSYAFPLSRLPGGLPGDVRLSWGGNWVQHFITVNAAGTFDGAGTTGGVFVTGPGTPRWTSFSNFVYTLGPWTLNANMKYVGGAVFDRTALPGGANAGLLSVNEVKALSYFGMGLAYDLPHRMTGHDVQLFAAVRNLTNLDPPPYGRDGSLDDTIGRFYTFGIRLKL